MARGRTVTAPDHVEELWSEAQQVRSLAVVTTDPSRIVLADVLYFSASSYVGRTDEASAVLSHADQHATDAGQPSLRW